MYEIEIPASVVRSWVCWDDWNHSPSSDLFNRWVQQYSEVADCEYSVNARVFTFRFESETLYQWFILRQ